MRAEHDAGALGHLVGLVDEHRAAGREGLHDVLVVDDLLAHVDRRAVELEGLLHRDDGAVDAGAVAAGGGEQDTLALFGHPPIVGWRRCPRPHVRTGHPSGARPRLDTTPDAPWPLRLLTHNIGMYVARMPALWVEAQIVSLKRRPGAALVFLDLRDTDVEMSMSATRPPRRWTPRARRSARAPAWSCGSSRASTPSGARSRSGCRSSARSARASCWPGWSSSSGRWPARACSPPTARSRCPSSPARSASCAAAAARPSTTSWRTPGGAGPRSASRSARSPSRARPPSRRSATRWPSWTPCRTSTSSSWPGAAARPRTCCRSATRRCSVRSRPAGPRSSRPSATRRTPRCWTWSPTSAPRPPPTPPAGWCPTPPTSSRWCPRPDGAVGRWSAGGWSASATCCGSCAPGPALTDLRGLFVQRAAFVDDCRARLRAATDRGLQRRAEQLRATLAHLRALSPQATLERGYAIVRTPAGAVVRGPDEVAAGDVLEVTVARGRVGVTVSPTRTTPGPGRR